MVDKRGDGGPAFPHWDGPSGNCFNGTTLRDYFAAKALPAIVSEATLESFKGHATEKCAAAARIAYGLADAMLQARK